MGRNLVETVMGAVVLLVAGLFVFLAYNTAQIKTVEGYEVTASFYKIGGLSSGSDVRISGVKVGTVLERKLDPVTFDAVVRMSISPDIHLPDDTVASIASEGLLGGKYIRLEPGTSTTRIVGGGHLTKTKDFRSLEDQVGEIIFLATNPGGGGGGVHGEGAPTDGAPDAGLGMEGGTTEPKSAFPDLMPAPLMETPPAAQEDQTPRSTTEDSEEPKPESVREPSSSEPPFVPTAPEPTDEPAWELEPPTEAVPSHEPNPPAVEPPAPEVLPQPPMTNRTIVVPLPTPMERGGEPDAIGSRP